MRWDSITFGKAQSVLPGSGRNLVMQGAAWTAQVIVLLALPAFL